MSTVRDKVVVITGAAGGIGRALALDVARRGGRLALSDVDERGLADTAALARAIGAEVHTSRVDVADRAAVRAHAADVHAHFGQVHQLYNNAGIAGGGATILDADWEIYDRVLAVNLWGVLHGTRAFLPHLVASGDGHVINISSLNGLLAQPELAPYCTSKFAVRGFTETLRLEMLQAGHPVRVTLVHPGGVRTNIASAALAEARGRGEPITDEYEARIRFYNDHLLRLSPRQAAQAIVRGVEADHPRVLIGLDARIADLTARALPRAYPALAGLLFQLLRY
ncbi:SDR family NAD(P)-dependent oxidoreductase [Frankia sp. Ag45/Mut15]|uniref:SDR family NAD(P)-dependent oxidoreductase n=1 Tax=Frankia umida TaxID=573489 RepID=A0ABT0JZS2_9ACTN|nr:SDR family NAD(P)-dependent oxidoreductase [Frankia umida]MCK9876732.1 SDR family NAD(P)-dependent oxidoreductase [Frankia umida]